MECDGSDIAALQRILRWRRDVRHFRPDPIPEQLIAELHAAMELAPSVGNARPWRVVRVDDPALHAAVRDDFAHCNAEAAESYQGQQRADYAALKLAGLDAAPLQLAVFTQIDPATGHGLGRATMPQTLRQSTAMAIHTLWLAARARNLGLGMVSILDPTHIGPLLDVPPDWEFAAWLCLGWPEFTDDMPLLHRAGWQENAPPDWLRR
ncbi:5,6-dimethylbenzimidazole synthase [Paracoccus laeviglucosivorans]|uniref:Cob(II)yrinic acid a,c-diamide reductase n=1 Tax=Paracoccus laeviglucosivorans TaxID=1197861 RepID=A0A521DVY0_9RHOB|nr:5,6-dimethylbenzimidazole synthase [Paracoccus laeviglucosivorans]SMO75752.1 cob(II)yrinic acid a,c-diamide reductase [Paracoccus laeviglucosivorans]